MSVLRILALEPYYGGSHRSFLDGWKKHSRHEFTILGLPAYKWKWRMRHSALTLAAQVDELVAGGESWELLFCSDMLPLAEFCGLTDPKIAALPRVFYFHENQLTYPNQTASDRDHHFAFTNFISAACANEVWFNSLYHLEVFHEAIQQFLKRMPDYVPIDTVAQLRSKSVVHSPGVPLSPARRRRQPGPLRILWAARWEHDKGPDDFFEALGLLKGHCELELFVLGESFNSSPPVFDQARAIFANEIRQWGYVESDSDYQQILGSVDVVVSTAHHEFFGIAVAEAAAAGVIPIVPHRLAYPEVIREIDHPHCIYDGTVLNLVEKLRWWSSKIGSLTNETTEIQSSMARYYWAQRAEEMDKAVVRLCQNLENGENRANL